MADVRDYGWKGKFDAIVIDITLHIFIETERLDVLPKLLTFTSNGSHVLIADERSNITALADMFEDSQWTWSTALERRGYLFMLRQ